MRPNATTILNDFEEKLRLQRYAPSSIKAYKNGLAQFLKAFALKEIQALEMHQIQSFLLALQQQKRLSASYQKQILASISKFYAFYYSKQLDLSFLYPQRKPKPLPKYLTILEVKRLLKQCKNQKHRCILEVLYGCGLRVSEVIALKIKDVDSTAMRILVRAAKGKKDRAVPLPQRLLISLRLYYQIYRPITFLFEGQNGGTYSVKSIQNFCKKYARAAGLKKRVSPHVLRHSYATHQLENGVHIRYVQSLLGHQSIKTTERYIHIADVANGTIPNPLDQL